MTFYCNLVRDRRFHQFVTIDRDNLRVQQHRTVAFDQLPTQVGVRLRNKLHDRVNRIKRKKSYSSAQTLLCFTCLLTVWLVMESHFDKIIGYYVVLHTFNVHLQIVRCLIVIDITLLYIINNR